MCMNKKCNLPINNIVLNIEHNVDIKLTQTLLFGFLTKINVNLKCKKQKDANTPPRINRIPLGPLHVKNNTKYIVDMYKQWSVTCGCKPIMGSGPTARLPHSPSSKSRIISFTLTKMYEVTKYSRRNVFVNVSIHLLLFTRVDVHKTRTVESKNVFQTFKNVLTMEI